MAHRLLQPLQRGPGCWCAPRLVLCCRSGLSASGCIGWRPQAAKAAYAPAPPRAPRASSATLHQSGRVPFPTHGRSPRRPRPPPPTAPPIQPTAPAPAALSAGASADETFAALAHASQDLPDGVPWPLLRRCVAAGLHPDTDVGGGTPLLHHLLARPWPPLLELDGGAPGSPGCDASGGGTDEDAGSCPVSLHALLEGRHGPSAAAPGSDACGPSGGGGSKGRRRVGRGCGRGATPDLPGPSGSTALHVLVGCLIERVHFPAALDGAAPGPSSKPGAPSGGGGDRGGGGGGGVGAGSAPAEAEAEAEQRRRDVGELLAESAADARRAVYARAAFAALLRAGWCASARDKRGVCAADLAALALQRSAADLDEIRDPRGLPQAALGAFVAAEGGGPARLRQLLDAHEAGAAAVEAALRGMADEAAAQRRLRAAALAGALLALWVLLVAVMWQWVARRQQS